MDTPTTSADGLEADSCQEKLISPSAASVKIIEKTKKSGEFDKYRREIVDNIIASNEMAKLLKKCRGIIEEALVSAPDEDFERHGISKYREFVRGEIKRRRLVHNSMSHVLEPHIDGVHPRMREKLGELILAEIGVETPTEAQKIKASVEENMEVVDMEVSSGATSGSPTSMDGEPSSTSSFKSVSTSNSPQLPRQSCSLSDATTGSSSSSSADNESGNNKITQSTARQKIVQKMDATEDRVPSSSSSASLSCNASSPASIDIDEGQINNPQTRNG